MQFNNEWSRRQYKIVTAMNLIVFKIVINCCKNNGSLSSICAFLLKPGYIITFNKKSFP